MSAGGTAYEEHPSQEGGRCYICGRICGLLCCPPCPSHIAAKVAFAPPNSFSYEFEGDDANKTMIYMNMETGSVEPLVFSGQSHLIMLPSGNHTIAAVYLELDSCNFTLLFSHGNAVSEKKVYLKRILLLLTLILII